MRALRYPVVNILIIGLFSTCVAVILFKAGGSLAEVTGQENTILGISFKAGGALGGFILIFWILLRGIERFQKTVTKVNLKLHLIGKPENFDRQDTTYVCKYWLFNEQTGERQEFSAKHRWEAGYLTLDVRDVGADDFIAVRIENAQKKVWECDFFHARAPKMEVPLVRE